MQFQKKAKTEWLQVKIVDSIALFATFWRLLAYFQEFSVRSVKARLHFGRDEID